jgi:hypothetical protein
MDRPPNNLRLLPSRVPDPETTGELPEDSSNPITLRYPPKDRQVTVQQLLGNALFTEASLLVLTVEEYPPITFDPASLNIIGRKGNHPLDVPLIDLTAYDAKNKGVSRIHAALHRTKRTIAIEDLDSANGTFVDGYRLKPHEIQVLHSGMKVSLGLVTILVTF